MKKLKWKILFVLIIGMLTYKLVSMQTIDFTKFDTKNWDRYPEKRYQMISDFESKYPIDSLTQEKIIGLLGEKNVTQTEKMYSYTIGSKFVFTEYYALIFNEKGQCIDRYVYR